MIVLSAKDKRLRREMKGAMRRFLSDSGMELEEGLKSIRFFITSLINAQYVQKSKSNVRVRKLMLLDMSIREIREEFKRRFWPCPCGCGTIFSKDSHKTVGVGRCHLCGQVGVGTCMNCGWPSHEACDKYAENVCKTKQEDK